MTLRTGAGALLDRASRRAFLRRVAAAAGTLSAACLPRGVEAPAAQKPGEGRPAERPPFTMFVYSGLTERAYRETFVPGFEARSGVRVTLDPGWWDMAAKLKVAPRDQTSFDLVMTDPTQGFPAIRDGLFTKIDLARVPNAARFAPRILDTWVYRDGWGVPFVSSAMSLAWNRDLVPGGLRSWADLFAEALKGEIMLYSASYMSLFTFAAAKVALDGRPGTAARALESDLDGVLRFAREKRDWVKYWWPATSEAVLALLQRNVRAGNLHGNGLITPLKESKPVGLAIPRDDRAYVQLFFLVPKSTRDRALAEDAINYIASPEVQRALVEQSGELSCNVPEVAADLAPRHPEWARVYPSSRDDWDSLAYYPYDVYDKHAAKIADFWNREILRRSS